MTDLERLLRAALNHDTATISVTGVYDPNPGTAAKLQSIDAGLTAFDSADAVIAASDCLPKGTPGIASRP